MHWNGHRPIIDQVDLHISGQSELAHHQQTTLQTRRADLKARTPLSLCKLCTHPPCRGSRQTQLGKIIFVFVHGSIMRVRHAVRANK